MAKTVSGYSSQQIWLHWVTVALVAVQMIFHEGISRAFSTGLEEGALYISPPVILHFLFGSAITFLVMWRLMLRNDRGVPGPPEGEPQIFQILSKVAHWGFYSILLLLPVTGAIAWGSVSVTMGNAHEILKTALFILILAHIGAVIVHQFVWKTKLLDRMRNAVD